MRYALAIAGVLLVSGCFGGGSKRSGVEGCPPPASTASAGNAQLTSQATGTGFHRTIVIHAKDKASGAPVEGAQASVYGAMVCPHVMTLIQKNLHEASKGTYKGQYSFIMPGPWTVYVILRSKTGATTSSIPVTIKSGR